MTNSILATYSDGIALPGNGSACIGTVASGGWNLVSDSTCHLTGTGDLVSPVVKLLPLDAYGGPTPTHATRRWVAGDRLGQARLRRHRPAWSSSPGRR